MNERTHQLSSRSIAVLEMIAAGSSYEQILAAYPDLTYLDIFRVAEEALDIGCQKTIEPSRAGGFADIRQSYPRAYEKWTDDEDKRLRAFIVNGYTVAQIAGRLQRQRGAIRSRIVKVNFVELLNPKERARLERISKLDAVPADPSIEA